MTTQGYDYLDLALNMAEQIGVLLVTCDHQGNPNVMTIGWLLLGRSYYKRPVAVIAVRPATYTFQLLDMVEEFVIAVPTIDLVDAVAYCGKQSGRATDKLAATSMTPYPSKYVTPPSIQECPVNIECRIYHKQHPPHQLLTPDHRKAPISEQHTIYFAEVLGVSKS
ncbi:MAG: flavin reductase family protein [Candidatus Bathyarchaeota archaeon]|nr:flavin reductase family protein [Candidatus Bathyarchaeota archaeon]